MFFGRILNRHEIDKLFGERLDADRRYNEALTAVDKAVPQPRELPHPPLSYDEAQLTPINERWNVLSGNGLDGLGGWRGRAARIVWGLLRPILERQQDFNAAVVDHLNRNVPVHRATRESIESTIAALREQAEALAAFHNKLVLYLQTVTVYVDTKDRSETLALIVHGLSSGIDALSDELQRRWEAMVSREQRYAAAVDELRTSIANVQQTGLTLKREMERLPAMRSVPAGEPAAAAAAAPAQPAPGGAASAGDRLNAYKYVGFENKFRGSEEDVRARQLDYAKVFTGASDVLDIGCGRGEFLAILQEAGVGARGLDLNHEMVEACRAQGLQVDEGDALSFLEGLPDASVGGLMAAQVVEHFPPPYLLRFLDTAYHKMRPGARLVLETVNAACWFAFFEAYLRDITHAWPLHPDTLKYLVVASGFQRVEVRMLSPYPVDARLQVCHVPPEAATPAMVRLVETLNENTNKLNAVMFSYADYAIVAERL